MEMLACKDHYKPIQCSFLPAGAYTGVITHLGPLIGMVLLRGVYRCYYTSRASHRDSAAQGRIEVLLPILGLSEG